MTEEKVVLDKASYFKLRDMLESPDKENTTVALSAIANCNIEKSMIYLVLLFRDYGSSRSWDRDAPEAVEALKALEFTSADPITTNEIYLKFKDTASPEEKETILQVMGEAITRKLIPIGFDSLKMLIMSLTEK